MPARCRKCAGCLLFKTYRTIAKCMYGFDGGTEWKEFLTLTTKAEPSWPRIMYCWQRLVRWLRKRYGPVSYACIKQEGKKTQNKHLHILLLGPVWISYRDVSAKWLELIGAWHVNIQRVTTTGRVAAYVSRYVASAMAGVRKAVTFSSGWRRSSPPKVRVSEVMRRDLNTAWPWAAITRGGTLVDYWGIRGECECPGRR